MFKIHSSFQPKGDQIQAIQKLVANFKKQKKKNILWGATGTGKTFTIANVISQLNQNVLVISHNKTLAIQLFSELKTFFPDNLVEYFISPFDFYQPEAYLPHKDLYIDKSVKWNLDIKKMRMKAMNAILSSEKAIVIATVAAIYGVLNPAEYHNFFLTLTLAMQIKQKKVVEFLIKAGYKPSLLLNVGAKFMLKGKLLIISLSHTDNLLRIIFEQDKIQKLQELEAVTFNLLKEHNTFTIYPGNEYVIQDLTIQKACQSIEKALKNRLLTFTKEKKFIEKHRLKTRTEQDLEDLRELGFCKGIENYSFHFNNLQIGDPPFTIIDYFLYQNQEFLTIIDESHITNPQIKGMYLGDYARKKNLVDYGFRLPTALENRPLTFQEFSQKLTNVIYVSATPGDYEKGETSHLVRQIIRPTGLLDPLVQVLPTTKQIEVLIAEIQKTVAANNRIFILTLTIQMAEDLTTYLQERGIKASYLHNRLKTFERTKVLINLRKGVFDVVIGINLLREGLDIPEVALVAIMDADKLGFLRGEKSLVQMIGRASRNSQGKVLLFADKMTKDMEKAISHTQEQRHLQELFNQRHNIVPQTIIKPIEDIFLDKSLAEFYDKISSQKTTKITKLQRIQISKILGDKIQKAVKKMDFELAAKIRDMMFDLLKNN